MASQIGAVNRSKNGRVSSPNQPQGSRALLNFGANSVGKSFIYPFDHDENGDDFFDEFLNQPEKKRRLSMDQVQFLEKCFVADNKLDPDRKIQIAKELGLQPRQITIWFQNRRARWKTRQLETDYEALHRNYQRLKAEYDDLFSDHQKLKAEVLFLKTNVQSELQTQGYEGSSRRGMADDLELSAMISRNESKSSMIRDEIYEDSLLFSAGLSCALESDHPNPIPDLDDESLCLSKVEFSHYLPNGNGFYLEFPMEDPALSYWSV